MRRSVGRVVRQRFAKPSTSVQIWYGPLVVFKFIGWYTNNDRSIVTYSIMNRRKSWTQSELEEAVKKSKSVRQVLGLLGLRLAGGNYTQIGKYIKEYNIDTTHFTGKAWNRGMIGIGKPRIELSKILIQDSYFQSFKLKKRLFAEDLKPKHCEECGWNKVSIDGRLPLELHHINGDSRDNRIENLIVLCPNCHSIKLSHRGCNIKKR
ncbi:MAG: hypothetical protein ACD_56C00036G0008 [uncultured bacterium]|nr:MAG: hypothetical protein ACD_56C00036G0008 [uncultured bacterium]